VTSEGAVPRCFVRPPGWLGAGTFSAERLLAWVAHAERLGFAGVFVGDRLLAEASASGEVVYGASMLEAATVLGAIAARTTRLRLGPLVYVFPYRHPLQVAKTAASLDVLSGGRFVLGAGIGWNEDEFRALGLSLRGRGERFEAALEAVRAWWRGEAVAPDADGAREPVRVTPLPVQPGGPPVWIASFSPGDRLEWGSQLPRGATRALRRVGRLGDGWVPLVYSASGKRRLDPGALAAAWEVVLSAAEQAGRSRREIDVVFSDWLYVLEGPASRERCEAAVRRFFAGDWDDMVRTYSIGTAEQIAAGIRSQVAGIDRVDAYVLTPLADDFDQLDLLAERLVPLLGARLEPAVASSPTTWEAR
jgi:probable F420-dependent oxidoreductase